MEHTILSVRSQQTLHCVRLHRGDDLLLSIRELAAQKHIAAGTVLSGVGCISEGRLRDASGITAGISTNTVRSSASTVPSVKQDATCTLPCPERTFPPSAAISVPAAL